MQNYYEILNLPLSASVDDIKKSYRHLAKKFHPDLCPDQEHHPAFNLITTAYKILVDGKERLLYNERLLKVRFRPGNAQSAKQRPEDRKRKVVYSRSLGVLARRGFFLSSIPKSYRKSMDVKYDVEVLLEAAEAGSAGQFEIDVPTKFPCPECGSRDHYCRFCDGKGYIIRATKIKVLLPKVPVSGEIFEVNLSGLRQGNLSVVRAARLRIRVSFPSVPSSLKMLSGQ
jgi:molecular chaperone DnaJ